MKWDVCYSDLKKERRENAYFFLSCITWNKLVSSTPGAAFATLFYSAQ
jgi:hypothetical protein